MADKITLITYEEFKRHINDICEYEKFQVSLNAALDKFNCQGSAHEDFATIDLPSLKRNLVELLVTIFNDKCRWIEYWLYDLKQGETYYSGCIKIDDKPVKLSTIQDLWDILTDNPHFEGS